MTLHMQQAVPLESLPVFNWKTFSSTGRHSLQLVEVWQTFSKDSVAIRFLRMSTTGPIGCLIFMGHFPRKSPIISGSFAGNDVHLKASYGYSSLCSLQLLPVEENVFQLKARSHSQKTRRYYGVATISRLLKITGLFCRISSLLQGSFAKETYRFKESTSRSHPLSLLRMSTSLQGRFVW